MNKKIANRLWLLGIVVLPTILGIYLSYQLLAEHADKTPFLTSTTSTGHHQIEAKCVLCHTPFKGVKDATCIGCHAQELQNVGDSHAASKFTDPRSAEQLKALNVLSCLTCHGEHLSNDYPNDVTIATDFCVQCHLNVTTERSTHKGMNFTQCHTCHNYHDNTALYEDFLAQHLDEPNLLSAPLLPIRNFLYFYAQKMSQPIQALTWEQNDAPPQANVKAAHDWLGSSHAQAGVNCQACHRKDQGTWVDYPDQSYCETCHKNETQGFLAGKHGMRVAQNLPPLDTADAVLPMRSESHTVNCVSCHKAHRFDTAIAAVAGCLGCHADAHSLAYMQSPHFRLWQAEQQGTAAPGSGVSCASCHLPRISKQAPHKKPKKVGVRPKLVKVEHNQNANLRPNQKMVRTVCQNCHGLQFTLDALADQVAIQNNFSHAPSTHIKSLDMVKHRQQLYAASLAPVPPIIAAPATTSTPNLKPVPQAATAPVATPNLGAVQSPNIPQQPKANQLPAKKPSAPVLQSVVPQPIQPPTPRTKPTEPSAPAPQVAALQPTPRLPKLSAKPTEPSAPAPQVAALQPTPQLPKLSAKPTEPSAPAPQVAALQPTPQLPKLSAKPTEPSTPTPQVAVLQLTPQPVKPSPLHSIMPNDVLALSLEELRMRLSVSPKLIRQQVEARLYAYAKKIPRHDKPANWEVYRRLAVIAPDNARYKARVALYAPSNQ